MRCRRGAGDHTLHAYYSTSWQILEDRIDGEADVENQYVWSPVYSGLLILRDCDTNDNGTFETTKRLYALTDATYNVTSLVGYNAGTSTWGVVERYWSAPLL